VTEYEGSCSFSRRGINNGRVDENLEKWGEKGSIVPQAYTALCAALEYFVKLAAQVRKINQSSVVSQASECCYEQASQQKKCGQKLFECKERNLAATLDIGEPDRIKQRREKWTTFSKVNIWFDSLHEFFDYFGFATVRELSDEENSEPYLERISQTMLQVFDKFSIILDYTAFNKGGHPAMSFFDPYLQVTPQLAAHKNSYKATRMYGCLLILFCLHMPSCRTSKCP
jgi:hypothetical protein